MRQIQRAGEKLFVDFCGQTVPITDPHTGEIRQAQIFVAVPGASSYTYAEAVESQGLADWIGAHVAFDGTDYPMGKRVILGISTASTIPLNVSPASMVIRI
jgi:hypothetical protein